MIAEITKEKKYQSRAFLLLPMSFNVAGILGPGKSNLGLYSRYCLGFEADVKT